jgi:hypothetical protein
MLLVITKPDGALAETTAPADLQKLLKLIGVTLSDKTTTQDVIDAVETLNERPDPSTRVDNALRNAITQLCLAAGVEGNKAITMASFLNDTLNKIREGKASISSISSLPEHLSDSLKEMETVLQMI